MYTTPSTQHHLHYITKLTIINTTPSTQHHQHNIIKHWQVQHLGHCHLTPSASCLLIPLFVFLRSGLFFVFVVDLVHSWMSEDLLTCGVIRSYNSSHLNYSVSSSGLQQTPAFQDGDVPDLATRSLYSQGSTFDRSDGCNRPGCGVPGLQALESESMEHEEMREVAF